jgi:hypothetical protein
MVMTAETIATLTATYLPHTCTIVYLVDDLDASALPEFDGYGDPIVTYAPSPSGAISVTVACWAQPTTGPDEAQGDGKALAARRWVVQVPGDTPVGEGSMITDVTGPLEPPEGPLSVVRQVGRVGHVTLECVETVGLDVSP